MNILLISPTSGGIGGIAQHVDGLSQFLTGFGHQVDVISSANTLTIPIKRLKNPSFMFSSFLNIITDVNKKTTSPVQIKYLRFFAKKIAKTHPNKNKIKGILFPAKRIAVA